MLWALWLVPAAGAGYTVKAACSAPAPGHAACLGLRLASPANPTPEPGGLSPAQLHRAYELPLQATEPQTIAIVDAYDDPHAEADLGVFDEQFGLPACTHENGCFTKLDQQGLSAPLPPPNGEWSIEISTDIQVAHSVCQNCRIVLVEASSAAFTNLEAAENTAAAVIKETSKPGALEGEISNSWGGEEPTVDSSAFNHPGIAITASSGDSGYLNWQDYETRNEPESPYFDGPSYPASSPHVVAVGGTSLSVDEATGEWLEEKVWNHGQGAGGGGCSAVFAAPPWQPHTPGWPSIGCGSQRAVADVAADAEPKTGVEAYDSVPEGLGTSHEVPGEEPLEYFTIGGTSVASPILASAFALAGGAHGVPYPAATLYAHDGTSALHDITVGGNGECNGLYNGPCNGSLASPLDCGLGDTICNAVSGFDGPTGVGTPIGLTAFQPVPGEIGGPEEGSGGGGPGEGPGGGGPGGGGQERTANPGGGSGARLSGPPSGTSKSGTSSRIRITGLSLTLGAIVALNRSRARLSKVSFTFTLTAPAAPVKVRVTLARWVRAHGHGRWSTLRGANTLAAHLGANRAHLSGRGALHTGRYRLTLTPAHGTASSIAISIG